LFVVLVRIANKMGFNNLQFHTRGVDSSISKLMVTDWATDKRAPIRRNPASDHLASTSLRLGLVR
jgi:hypothetical protein